MSIQSPDDRSIAIVKLFLELVALIVVCFGSWYAFQHLGTLQREIDDNQQARRLAARPWILYSSYQWEVERDGEWMPTDRLKAGEKFRVRLSVSHAGATPAVDVRYRGLASGKAIDDRRSFEGVLPLERVDKVPDPAMIPPGTFVGPGVAPEHHPSQLINEFEGQDFEGLTGQDFAAFKSRNKTLLFRGRIEYCDVRGQFYWTEVAILRFYGELSGRFAVDRQSLGPAAGEPDDPRCTSSQAPPRQAP